MGTCGSLRILQLQIQTQEHASSLDDECVLSKSPKFHPSKPTPGLPPHYANNATKLAI